MKPYFFLWLLISLLLLSGCTSKASSPELKDANLVNIEGCGLDGFFKETRVSACDRKLTIDAKQDIEVLSDAIEAGTATDGPLTAAGHNYEFTFVLKNEEMVHYKVWLTPDFGSFEKSQDEGESVRYRFEGEDVEKVIDVMKREMNRNPNS